MSLVAGLVLIIKEYHMMMRKTVSSFCIVILMCMQSVYAMESQESVDKKPIQFAHHKSGENIAFELNQYVDRILSRKDTSDAAIVPYEVIEKIPGLYEFNNALAVINSTIKRAEFGRLSSEVVEELKIACVRAKELCTKINTVDAVYKDHLYSIILLRAAIAINLYVRKVILDTLHTIDMHIAYWEEQSNHSVRHFMQQLPNKWFTGTMRKEINQHLRSLRTMRQKYYGMLGQLTARLGGFDIYAVPEKQYEWMLDLMETQLDFFDSSSVGVTTQEAPIHEKINQLMPLLLSTIQRQKKEFIKDLEKHKKPSHIRRNWLLYSTGAVGTVLASIWIYRNYHKMPGWFESIKKNVWERMIVGPFKAVKNVFWDNEQSRDGTQDVKQAVADMKKIFGKGTSDKEKLCELYKDVMKRCLAQDVFKDINGVAINQAVIDQAAQGFVDPRNGDGDLAVKLLDHATIKFGGNIEKEAKTPAGYTDLLSKVKKEVNAISDILVPLLLDFKVYTTKLQALNDPMGKCLDAVEQLLHDSEKMLKQNKVTAALTAIVPTALVIYGGTVGVKKMWNLQARHNYKPIQDGLIEIAHVLNMYNDEDVYPTDMGPEDYGKFVYLLHKLRKEVHQVPLAKRAHFRDDIKKLKSPILTAKKKMKIVDLMYKTYDFLSPETA